MGTGKNETAHGTGEKRDKLVLLRPGDSSAGVDKLRRGT
jgi:hypothetical protein